MNYKIIAHRGESFDAPENTLASINLAWERSAGAVEIDVHLSRDNRVVAIHDSTTKRTGGLNKKVKDQTLSELRLLDVGSWKNIKYKDERIPTLIEILKTVPEKKRLIIEIKSGKKSVPFLKYEILQSKISPSQVEVISFDYNVIKIAKKLMPEIKMLYLAELDYSWMSKLLSPPVEKLIEKVKKADLEGLNVWSGEILDQEFLIGHQANAS